MSELAKRTVFGSLFVVVMIGSILLSYWAFFVVMIATVIIGSQEVSKLMVKEDNRRLTVVTVVLGTLFLVMSVVLYPYSPILQMALLLTPFIIALFSKKYSFDKVVVSCWTSILFVALPCVLMMDFYWNSPLRLDGKYLIIMLIMVVLPVPGPPVITVMPFFTAFSTASL